MAFIYDSLVVADIAALKLLTSSTTPKRVDGVFLAVGDRGDGFPDWYLYKQSASDTEDLPAIVSPGDGVGRYFQFKGEAGNSGGGGGNTPYQIKTSDYTLVSGDKIIVVPDYTVEESKYLTLTLPANPEPMWEVEIFVAYIRNTEFDYNSYDVVVDINSNGNNFMSNSWSIIYAGKTTSDTDFYNGGKLIYINSMIGWMIVGNYDVLRRSTKGVDPFRYYSN